MKSAFRAIGLLMVFALPACRSAGPIREAREQAHMGARAVKFHLYAEAYFRFKKAAALVNRELGVLAAEKAQAIVRAADEVLDGAHR